MSPGGGAHGFIKGVRVMGLDWGDRRCGERFAFFSHEDDNCERIRWADVPPYLAFGVWSPAATELNLQETRRVSAS